MNENDILEFERTYHTPSPTIPTGWVSTGEFRSPKHGEFFLTSNNAGVMRNVVRAGKTDRRLIVTAAK